MRALAALLLLALLCGIVAEYTHRHRDSASSFLVNTSTSQSGADACEQMAAKRGLARLFAGVNSARQEAYRQMLARGFRTEIQGVVMSRPTREVTIVPAFT